MVDKDSVRDETGELSEETDVRTNIRRPPLRRSTVGLQLSMLNRNIL